MQSEFEVTLDGDLLDRARSGDREAATEFARRHAAWAIALAWKHGAGDSSEDVVQDLLARLMTGDNCPAIRGSARAYMSTAIIRRAAAVAEVQARSAGGPGDQWPSDQTSITGRLAKADDAIALRRSISALPAYQREVVDLRLGGLDNAEIAAATGRTHGSIRVYMSRAVASLRCRLG